MATELEFEKTYLLKTVPSDLTNCDSIVIEDRYVPQSVDHPVLRLRRYGDWLGLTKKYPVQGSDSSTQYEHTIVLNPDEYAALAGLPAKTFVKRRYYYPLGRVTAEIDVYQGQLQGLATVDVEFATEDDKQSFLPPDFCGPDVTQDSLIAGGMLAGKSYNDIADGLAAYGYEKIDVL